MTKDSQALTTREPQEMRNKRLKLEWQQRSRDAFKAKHGYSQILHYRFAGNREAALKRDNYCCVKCGMTDVQHREKWSRPITVDHRDRDESNNALDNLQTLCFSCHGRKDILPRLIEPRCIRRKDEILAMHAAGNTLQTIADKTGFSISSIWKWIGRWNTEAAQ